ncbi:unnamed protein product [Nezara viridula]|uniref:Dynein heavy chain hydrolytic ATP-binding dynein motor region domain-containing protein n=1 Tax=Nezara viridula TaxID=85310 RepID=A0A9P0EC56_NEZVI|nr:unnamed protein product [Nezara viridula]
MGATHFISVDFETIKFQPPITKWPAKSFPDVMYTPRNDPYYEEKAVPLIDAAKYSGVELWIWAIDRHVKTTMRTNIIRSLKNFTNTRSLFRWLMSWPGQATQVSILIYFAALVESGIKRDSLMKREKDYDTILYNLRQILITRDMPRLKRKIVFNICVVCSHGSGIFDQLIMNGVIHTKDFIWDSQLRYYWHNHQLKIKCFNTIYDYGYEYLGICQRLMTTPLTERCFLTITQALRYVLGAKLIGTTGSGKSETIRDLAKASAILLFGFSCSNLIDYSNLTAFMKGTACTGSWTCLDDFDRISPGLISVIAQLFGEICQALKKKSFT